MDRKKIYYSRFIKKTIFNKILKDFDQHLFEIVNFRTEITDVYFVYTDGFFLQFVRMINEKK